MGFKMARHKFQWTENAENELPCKKVKPKVIWYYRGIATHET